MLAGLGITFYFLRDAERERERVGVTTLQGFRENESWEIMVRIERGKRYHVLFFRARGREFIKYYFTNSRTLVVVGYCRILTPCTFLAPPTHRLPRNVIVQGSIEGLPSLTFVVVWIFSP